MDYPILAHAVPDFLPDIWTHLAVSPAIDRLDAFLVKPLGFERRQGRPTSRYRFTIPLYQITLYNQMDEAERAGLHEQVTRGLESLFDPPPGSIAREIAFHYQRACNPEKAAIYLAMLERECFTPQHSVRNAL